MQQLQHTATISKPLVSYQCWFLYLGLSNNLWSYLTKLMAKNSPNFPSTEQNEHEELFLLQSIDGVRGS